MVIKMNKKFKEYRMFLVCFVIFIAFLGVAVYCGLEDEIYLITKQWI